MQDNEVSKSIVNWYTLEKRDLPFRHSRDPYKIWLSEVMLQQTKVITMLPYYRNWIKKYPDIKSVINTSYQKLLKDWEGLGYYNRCLNFYNSLKIVYEDYNGQIPKDYMIFRKMPGVGDYTASAVLSIAYNKKHILMDGNVKRVFSRYLGIKNLTKYNLLKIIKLLKILIQFSNSNIFNQAIMELGALVCKKNDPMCYKCPINVNCIAFFRNNPQSYPKIFKKKIKPTLTYLSIIVRVKNKILIIKNEGRLLNGLWDFPILNFNIKYSFKYFLKEKINIKRKNTSLFELGFIKHSYSHFSMKVTYYEVFIDEIIELKEAHRWITKKEITNYPFTKIFFKSFKLISN